MCENSNKSFANNPELQCDIEQEFFDMDVRAVRLRNSQSKDVDFNVFSDGETNGNRMKYLFESAERSLKVYRYGNRKLAEKLF